VSNITLFNSEDDIRTDGASTSGASQQANRTGRYGHGRTDNRNIHDGYVAPQPRRGRPGISNIRFSGGTYASSGTAPGEQVPGNTNETSPDERSSPDSQAHQISPTTHTELDAEVTIPMSGAANSGGNSGDISVIMRPTSTSPGADLFPPGPSGNANRLDALIEGQNESETSSPMSKLNHTHPPLSRDMFLDDFCPHEFTCPIGCEVMLDPVCCADGHTYDRENIASWLERSDRSPMTNEMLSNKDLVPNVQLRRKIREYMTMIEASKDVQLPCG
jgi:hypothetical protein